MVEAALNAAVRVVYEPFAFLTQPLRDGLLERIERQITAERVPDLPSDDAAAEHIDDERHVYESVTPPHIGQI